MPLRLARLDDLPVISSIYAASFWDEEVVGGIMHPHRHEYPQDYADFWKRRVWDNYWDYGHKLMVFFLDGGETESGVNGETGKVDEAGLVVGIADWHRMGTGWEKVWGVWGGWDISRFLFLSSLYLLQVSQFSCAGSGKVGACTNWPTAKHLSFCREFVRFVYAMFLARSCCHPTALQET